MRVYEISQGVIGITNGKRSIIIDEVDVRYSDQVIVLNNSFNTKDKVFIHETKFLNLGDVVKFEEICPRENMVIMSTKDSRVVWQHYSGFWAAALRDVGFQPEPDEFVKILYLG